MSMHNAVTAQQNSQMSASASVTASCAKMLQAAPPVPAPAPVPPTTPPPFMPLDPDTDKSAADFVKQATQMAEEAINLMDADASANAEDKKGLKELLSKLQAFTGSNAGGNKQKKKTKKKVSPAGHKKK